MSREGIVYILTNPAMPGLTKIGKTVRGIGIRMNELFSTGVPLPFECSFAGKVEDVDEVEKAFHEAFRPYKINPSREFFEIEDSQAIKLLRLLSKEDVTPQINNELDQVDEASKQAGQEYSQKKRPNFNFKEMGIPVGSILHSVSNSDQCEVLDERNVRYKDVEMSMSKASQLMQDVDYAVPPMLYWTFSGRLLREIYNETYNY